MSSTCDFSFITTSFRRPWRGLILEWLCRLSLGLIFIYAALPKITDPTAFALTLNNYRLFPLVTITPLAFILPWLEFWAGILVLCDYWKRPAALILGILLTSFILIVSYNLYRGLDFECGCFGNGRRTGMTLLEQDALLLACAVILIVKKHN
ncbi:MAG: hypothetical protein AMR96_03285 [Candidatus Adiutrix intracellularis]|nr:MAG: hypothetical protein AMR96_03285 [Candidatus Adiutrix intracellularis]